MTVAGSAMLVAAAISVYLPPLMANLSWHNIPVLMSAPAFFLAAGFLGSVLPLLCQSSVSADNSAGKSVSLIYLSNIIGSTLGSLVVGFVLMNYFGTQAISMQLAAATALTGFIVILFRRDIFRRRRKRCGLWPICVCDRDWHRRSDVRQSLRENDFWTEGSRSRLHEARGRKPQRHRCGHGRMTRCSAAAYMTVISTSIPPTTRTLSFARMFSACFTPTRSVLSCSDWHRDRGRRSLPTILTWIAWTLSKSIRDISR